MGQNVSMSGLLQKARHCDNKTNEINNMQQEYERLKMLDLKNKEKKKVNFSEGTNTQIKSRNLGVSNRRDSENYKNQKVDPMFDPELMRHYEKVPVIEYPKISENNKINET